MSSKRYPPNVLKPNTFCFLHINIHGLTFKDSLYKTQLATIFESQPNIVSINELNLNIHKEDIYRKVYQACVIKGLPISMLMNHNHDPSDEVVKYGGVVSAIVPFTV